MISVICVYNNKEILDNFLLKSLNDQTTDFELILIDNSKNRFNSAAEALNYGGKKAKGNYLMFIHQDVDFSSKSWLENGEKILNSLENLGVAGIAGKSRERKYISNIKHGIPPKNISEDIITKPTLVQTIDECLFIIPRKLFDKMKFDYVTCNHWHLYGVDYCLQLKIKGYEIYVLPLFLYHRSSGFSLSIEYEHTLKRLMKKYRTKYVMIFTTMGDWLTFYPLYFQKRWPRVKNIIMKILITIGL
jgi:GT2 family glycosyltransferase